VNFVINRNGFNVSSFLFCRFPDEYYKPDFGIEASCWQDESGPMQDSVRGGPQGLSESGLGILGMLLDF
ncbi:hypothetical protein RclHR1_11760001, partial [Rhizophagus clarus]